MKKLLTLAIMLFAYCISQGEQVFDAVGTWRVTEIACDHCGKRIFSEEGSQILISREKVSNPLSDNCDSGVGLSLIKVENSRHLLATTGKHWPSAVKQTLVKQQTVKYGFITCDGLNYMQIAVLSPKKLLYFYEGGEVFTLTRLH